MNLLHGGEWLSRIADGFSGRKVAVIVARSVDRARIRTDPLPGILDGCLAPQSAIGKDELVLRSLVIAEENCRAGLEGALMSILRQITRIVNSASDYWYSPSVTTDEGVTATLSGVASDGSFSDESLSYSESVGGQPAFGPLYLGNFPVAGTDSSTGISFDNWFDGQPLSRTSSAVIFTTPAGGNFDRGDRTAVEFQPFNASGHALGPMKVLDFNGQSSIADLHEIHSGVLATFGSSFTLAYSTYDPTTKTAKIAYTQFDDSGDPLQSGVLRNFNDGDSHGLGFGTFYAADNPNNGGAPDFLLLNRANGSDADVQLELYGTNMQPKIGTTLAVSGPDGETPNRIDHYDYARPGNTSANNFTVVSETFQYTDRSGQNHEEIELEKLNPDNLHVEARTWFPDNSGSKTNADLELLNNGNVLAIYNDGGQSYVKEFNANLQQIGQSFALPNDNYGFDSIDALGNDNFRIDWRSTTGSDQTVKHHAVFHA